MCLLRAYWLAVSYSIILELPSAIEVRASFLFVFRPHFVVFELRFLDGGGRRRMGRGGGGRGGDEIRVSLPVRIIHAVTLMLKKTTT